MKDDNKAKEQLMNELMEARHRVARLEAIEKECKLAEKALRESQEFNSSLLEQSPNPISVINPVTSIYYSGPGMRPTNKSSKLPHNVALYTTP